MKKEAAGTEHVGNRKVILVADEEVMRRNLIRKHLHDEGYDVLAAADGEEALELSRAHAGTIDLMLTDVEMAYLDGIMVYRQIEMEQLNPNVLLMSDREPAQLKLTRPWSLLTKPSQLGALLTQVKVILGDHEVLADRS